MELRHLRDFVAVAEELSFTRAAERLHVAQPSLTHQLNLLEGELGVPLLDRTKGRVSLTEAGTVFLADAKRVLALSAESVLAVQRLNRSETKQLRIAYVSSLHYHLLPATLTAFQKAYPEVALNLFDMTSAEQIEALEAGKIDLGFVGLRESLVGKNLRAECGTYCEILAALPRANALSKKPRIDLKELETCFSVGMSERAYPGSHEMDAPHRVRSRLFASNLAGGRWCARRSRLRCGGLGSRAATGTSQTASALRDFLSPAKAAAQDGILHHVEAGPPFQAARAIHRDSQTGVELSGPIRVLRAWFSGRRSTTVGVAATRDRQVGGRSP